MRMESEKLWNALRPSEEAVNVCMGYEVSRLDYKYVDELVPDFESLREEESEEEESGEEEIREFLDAYDYFMTHQEDIWADYLLPAERDLKVYRLHIELDLSPIGQTQNGSSTFGVDPDIAAFLKTAKAGKRNIEGYSGPRQYDAEGASFCDPESVWPYGSTSS